MVRTSCDREIGDPLWRKTQGTYSATVMICDRRHDFMQHRSISVLRALKVLGSITVLACGLLLASITGCATGSHTTGRPITQAKVNQIVEGQTTMDQVIAWFGRPDSQTPMGQKTLYTYKHTKIKNKSTFMPYWSDHDSEEKSDELTLVFDADGVVETYSISRGL
jgi:hypothetical protein